MVRWIPFQQFEIFPGYLLNHFRECVEATLETACGAMHLEFLQPPLFLFSQRFLDQKIQLAGL
jgi:hypothetical protein